MAYRGAKIAREVADEMGPRPDDDMPRFVVGSMGPGTKLPSLGHAPYVALRDAYVQSARGLIRGGCDAILIETCQDLLQVKAAVLGTKQAFAELETRVPIIVHITVETTGTMLLGSEIGAALTALTPLGIDMIGMNCATGPDEMSEHLRYLSRNTTQPVSVMPNAGLPVLGANGAEYPLTAPELGVALRGFVADYGLSMVGGCCMEDFFDLQYRGARFSFGYGSCPDMEDRRALVDMLEAEKLGVVLSEELQLHPEQSTDAFVLYHPEAKYFNV